MATFHIDPASEGQLRAYMRDPLELSAMLGSPVPLGWPEFPEAIENTLTILETHPEQADWWMYFFLDADTLVGSGGFAGPPDSGRVEIGYEIAPEFRRRGYATAATKALVDRAATSGQVDFVIAHTLASDERSAGVLRAARFSRAGRVVSPDDGEVDYWELRVRPAQA
jgi:[ribosomal protein S5]-alanine N-acetyltransferase